MTRTKFWASITSAEWGRRGESIDGPSAFRVLSAYGYRYKDKITVTYCCLLRNKCKYAHRQVVFTLKRQTHISDQR